MSDKTEKSRSALILGAFLCACGIATPSLGVETESAEALLKRIDALEKRNADQLNALRALSSRLQQLETRLSPAAPPKPAPQPQVAALPSKPEPPQERDATPDKPAAGNDDNAVKSPAHSRVVQTVVEAEHASFDRKLTVEAGMSYSRSDRKQLVLSGFLALDAIFLGRIQVDEVAADIFTFDVSTRYSLTPSLQLSATVPFLYRNTTYTKSATSGGVTETTQADVTMNGDLGDISFGASYRLLPETADFPDVVLSFQAKAPTGSHPYGIGTRSISLAQGNVMVVPEKLPSGNGLWALSTGLSFLRTADPVVLFGSLMYVHNFARTFEDVAGQPEIDLGDAFQYSLGMAIALNERTSMSLSYSQRLSQAARQKVGGIWVESIGSDANAASLNFGATYALSDRLSLVANIGAGLTPDAPDLTVSLRLPYTF